MSEHHRRLERILLNFFGAKHVITPNTAEIEPTLGVTKGGGAVEFQVLHGSLISGNPSVGLDFTFFIEVLVIEFGGLLGEAFRDCRQNWPFEVNANVLLPDHLHAIWTV